MNSPRGPRTLLDKIWDEHVVVPGDSPDAPDLLYIDLHLVQEVSSPQAFDELRAAERGVRRPDLTIATQDHSVPTRGRRFGVKDVVARTQIEQLARNCEEFGVPLLPLGSADQGIVHVIGPELGLSQPGMVIVCGDSHTSTHGAFGALAFGIGTSEVAHVLATQCLPQRKPRTMLIEVGGRLPAGTTAKDLALTVIRRLGTGGGTGHVIEYRGEAVAALSMEARMTLCNMSIEAGARAALIPPDEVTLAYLRGRRRAPGGQAWDQAVAHWSRLCGDLGARYDASLTMDAGDVVPTVTWGTNPAMSAPVTGHVPHPRDTEDPEATARALEYQGISPGTPIEEIAVDRVFIGSCTNARIEDLRSAAAVLRGRTLAAHVRAMVVPGSAQVKAEAEREGLDVIFRAAGFEWRDAGCSMCLSMSEDVVAPGERCASTSNRNFEGRQGPKSRTHLVSPAMAAAAAVAGHFTDVRRLKAQETSEPESEGTL
ncbi:3-isopropylmalate dehydratase large subunit [Nonomuraea cavernae]|uniref:3-isopropylmalate dehydratase large subunit n=1 Tax=Nonomuraea cavernae TaxID=2045107 RepID=UPI0033FE33FB